jgi:predicted secreted protein
LLGLPDDTSDDYIWQLQTYDTNVIDLQADPTFHPSGQETIGALVWTFDVVAAGATDLKLVYADESGSVRQQFFVSISVQEVTVAP